MCFKNNIILLFFFFILITGCSSSSRKSVGHKTHPYDNSKSIPDHVNLVFPDKKNIPNVNIAPPEETVRIGESGGDHFDNPLVEKVADVNNEIKKLKIGLSFGPGIYRSISYVSLLKVLERQNLSPYIITGTGMGAVVAAMYAVGMTPEAIEWSFYKYFNEKKNNKIYDQDWINDLDQHLLSKFKLVNIEDTKKKFYITLYDHKIKKTYYFDKGNIRTLLLSNLRLSNEYLNSDKKQRYSTAFQNEVFNARLLRQIGAEFTISVDALGRRFDFDSTNEFLIGVYGKTASRIQKEKKGFDYNLTLPLSTMNLDSTKESSQMMQKTYEYAEREAPLILKKLKVKAESLLNLGNK